jgi:molybdate transport system substrate-binding protein
LTASDRRHTLARVINDQLPNRLVEGRTSVKGRQEVERLRSGIVLSVIALVMSVALGPGGGPASRLVAAQSFECAQAATPAVSQAAVAPPVAEDAATPAAAFPEEGGELTVFAAASLTDAFNSMKETLESDHEGLTITYNFGGSPTLVTQLAEGAAADVVALASLRQMDAAIEQEVIAGEATNFAQNRLAIVVPADNPADVQTPVDLAKDGLTLVVAAAEVPVGQYARESVCKMGNDETRFGEGFVSKVAANVVSEEDNVKAVLTKVAIGEADAGFVYTTDVTADVADDVLLIDIPTEVNVIARYPIAAAAGGDAELAQAFIDYVLGKDGQATLVEFGFEPFAA